MKRTKSLNLNDFQEDEFECAMRTVTFLKEDLILYEHTFNLLLEMIEDVASKKTPLSAVQSAVWFMTPRIVQSLKSIRDLTLNGYYYDASVIQRSFIESIGLCAYLSQASEKEALNWIDGKDVGVAKINLFSYATKLVKNAKTIDDKRSKALYGKLCGYTHSNPRALVTSFFHKADSSNFAFSTSLTPIFDEKQVGYIAHWALFTVAVLKEIFYDELKERERNRITKLLNRYLHEMSHVL
jgi:hypothetical protein